MYENISGNKRNTPGLFPIVKTPFIFLFSFTEKWLNTIKFVIQVIHFHLFYNIKQNINGKIIFLVKHIKMSFITQINNFDALKLKK